jgi:PAS domain S-box-containing protein/putative nucleotidyltransferase with HDIG domain
MPYNDKTQEQLAQEIESLRSQLTDLRLEHIKRKQAEEDLWESERRFLRLLDGLPLAVFVLDAEGKPYYQNKASRELFGKDIGPEAGGHLQEAFQAYLAGTDQVYPTERSPIHRALAGESSTVEDMEIRRPDKTIPVEAYGSPIYNLQGGIKYAVGVFHDIFERLRAEEALRRSEAFTRAVITHSPVGITVRNREGTLVLYNEAWKKTWTLTDEKVKENERISAGWSFEERYPHLKAYAPNAQQLFQEGGELFIPEVETGSTDPGVAQWVSMHFYALQNAEGQVEQIVTLTEDITARKTIEESLRQSEERYRSLMDNLNVGVYRNTPGPKGKFIEANPALVKMFGYTAKEEIFEINVSDLYEHPEDRTQINEKLLRDGYVRNEVLRLKKTEGTPLWGSVTAVAVRDEVGTVIYYDGIIEDVTERKRAEEALRESEERYRAVMEQTAEGIVLYDVDTKRVLAVNPAYCQLLGYSPEEMLQLRIYDIVAADPQTIDHTFQRIREERRAVIAQQQHRAKDGTLIDMEIRANLITFGAREALCVVVRDISERKRSELALSESEERYRTLVENVNIGVYRNTGGPQGQFVQVNPAMVKMFGYVSAEEIMARPVAECYQNPEEREQFIAKVKRHGFARDEELRLRKKDGSPFWASVTAQAQFDARGEVLWIDGVIEDITERKRAEEALRESEGKYRKLVELTRTGFLMLNHQGAVIDANPEYVRLTGHRTLVEILGRSVVEWTAEYEKEKNARAVEECTRVGYVTNLEIDYVDGQGKITPIEINAFVEGKGEALRIISLCRDISERRRAEETLQNVHKELEQRVQERTAEIQEATRNLETRNQQLSRILDTGGILLVSLELDALLNEIAKAARDTLGFEIVVLNLIDEKTREARFAAQAGLGEQARKALEGATVRVKWEDIKGVFQERFRVSRSCYFIPHGTVDWRTHAPATGPIAQDVVVGDHLERDPWHPEDALLAMVELREKTVAGMFSLDSPRNGRRPTRETLLMLDVFANLAAVAIDNSRLYTQVQRELGERKQAQEALRQAHGELERRVDERTGELRDTLGKLRRTTETFFQAMAMIVEMKDPYTAGHQRNVANLANAIAQELKLDAERTEGLRIAAMIHDVGKIAVPTEILTRPGPLSEVEHRMIKTHPQLSYDILRTIEFPWPVAEIVWQHHEKLNGSGYPQGLREDQIKLEAKILSVADTVESLALHRPYRPGKGIDLALEEIARQRGELYDQVVVDACLRLFAEKRFAFE